MTELETAVQKAMVIWSAEYLSKANTIAYLQGTVYTLNDLVEHGLKRHMIGRRAYYKKSDVNQIIGEL